MPADALAAVAATDEPGSFSAAIAGSRWPGWKQGQSLAKEATCRRSGQFLHGGAIDALGLVLPSVALAAAASAMIGRAGLQASIRQEPRLQKEPAHDKLHAALPGLGLPRRQLLARRREAARPQLNISASQWVKSDALLHELPPLQAPSS